MIAWFSVRPDRPDRCVRQSHARLGIVGHDDRRRVHIEDRDSGGRQTSDHTEYRTGEADFLPKPFTTPRAVNQLFLNDFLILRHRLLP